MNTGKTITLCCAYFLNCWAWSEPTNQPVSLLPGNSKKEILSFQAITLQRQQSVKQLIAVLDGDYPRESKLDAASALGVYRATEGIDALIRNLSYDMDAQAYSPDSLMKLDDIFPISKALEKIGTPATPALIKRIIKTDNLQEARLCARICLAIEGKEIARLKFQRAIAAESDSTNMIKLHRAMTFLNNKKINFDVVNGTL